MKTFFIPLQVTAYIEVKAKSVDDAKLKYEKLTTEQVKRRLVISEYDGLDPESLDE